MQTGQALRMGADTLRGAGVPDPETDAAALLCGVTALTPLALRLTPGRELEPEQEERFRSLLLLRTRREPLQYLLASTQFLDLQLKVTPAVLIPRPETEVLAEWAVQRLKETAGDTLKVLDLCTGSGCLGLYLARHEPRAQVVASAGAGDHCNRRILFPPVREEPGTGLRR